MAPDHPDLRARLGHLRAVAVLIALAGVSPAAWAGSTAKLRLSPARAPGGIVHVEVLVALPAALGAYTLESSFDPSAVEVIGITGGSTPEFSQPPMANRAAGTVRFAAFQGARPDGPTGRLHVATLVLRLRRATARLPLRLRALQLVDTAGNVHRARIAHTTLAPRSRRRQAAALSPTPVPETGRSGVVPSTAAVSGPAAAEIPAAGAITCGDVTGDGAVDIRDALQVVQFAVGARRCGEPPFVQPEACDVNPQPGLPGSAAGNGQCDVADALVIGQCTVGLRDCRFVCEPYACPLPLPLAQHVLNRTGYGWNDDTRARLRELGVERYIREQLQPEDIDDGALETMLTRLPSLEMGFQDLRAAYPQQAEPGQPRLLDVLRELQEAKLLRAIAGRRQLQEVLVDFWFNHFNVMTAGNRRGWDISPYERLAIRPHVLGRFRDLLLATARSPAMGDYLDNRLNRVNALNENYARELLELHTLGVDGGYTEADVVEVARCFTGWRSDYDAPDGFRFQASWHDQGRKTIMGVLEIPSGGGEQDGVDVIEFLAAHPSTARFIARKLVVRFVSEEPPAALVAAAADTYLATGGDLRAVMETILLSPEFLDEPAYRGTKVKRPPHLFASLARALGADPGQLDLARVRNHVRDLGEDLYKAPPPTGYPDASGFWTSPGTVLLRFNWTERAARGLDGFRFAWPAAGPGAAEITDALLARLFVAPVSGATHDTVVAFVDLLGQADHDVRLEQAAAVLLSSPEFLQH